ncbi:CLUMA_CG015456, isoform A [Clunio marinus]|uniref:CLUMA_CG015456, isoform A n=1 Tax=Clunio marinus TaxID=568069 RepID=A0A1J1IQE7_9DIPT|nr:CLUMA_CG015456, isoform A [Clunio marinus]
MLTIANDVNNEKETGPFTLTDIKYPLGTWQWQHAPLKLKAIISDLNKSAQERRRACFSYCLVPNLKVILIHWSNAL